MLIIPVTWKLPQRKNAVIGGRRSGEISRIHLTENCRRISFYGVNSVIMKLITSALKHVATV